MKVTKERNPYLKRILSQQPHKYSYDLQTGKYHLIDKQGKNIDIFPTGNFKPKFRANYSGFVTHKDRYRDSQGDPSVLHYAPQLKTPKQYYNPMQERFAGYAQFPYKLGKQFPAHLCKTGDLQKITRKKAASVILSKQKKIQPKKQQSQILQQSTTYWGKQGATTYFEGAWDSMVGTKPLPKHLKKTCYNYRCKYMKQFVFDERSKIQQQRNKQGLRNTFSINDHDINLQRELQQTKLLSTMALTGTSG